MSNTITYNVDVGEEVDTKPGVILVGKNRTRTMGTYRVVYDYAFEKATNETKDAVKTLNKLMMAVEYENVLMLEAQDIANGLSCSLSTVQRHIAIIRKFGIIAPHEKSTGSRFAKLFRICPFLSWKGKASYKQTYINNLTPDHHWFTYLDQEYRETIQEMAKSNQRKRSLSND